MERYSTTDY